MHRPRCAFAVVPVALAIAIGVTACGDGVVVGAPSTTTSSTTTTTTTTVPVTTAAAPAPLPATVSGVYAFGDSVMVDARGALESRGIIVDAGVNRQFFNAAGDLTLLGVGGRLQPKVVIGLGTNGPFNAQQFDAVMQSLAGAQLVAFVNICAPRPWQDAVNTALREGVDRWKTKAVLVDWHAAACGHPEWFAVDRVHMEPSGANVYADLVVDAVS
jgi:hypothetical protein